MTGPYFGKLIEEKKTEFLNRPENVFIDINCLKA